MPVAKDIKDPPKAPKFAVVAMYISRGKVQHSHTYGAATEAVAKEKAASALKEYANYRDQYFMGVYELKGVLRQQIVPIEYVTAESQ